MPITLCENPHNGALREPFMKATTLFSLTSLSISSSRGTVSCTWRPGVRRRSAFFLGGGLNHVVFPVSFPGGIFPVAAMCSSNHDFQAWVRDSRSGFSTIPTLT
uniref:Uncharacterized protein n=1 Tax=Opuntia streptacantha TaxID=393608 RepID=A0A7C9FQV5_OPUST